MKKNMVYINIYVVLNRNRVRDQDKVQDNSFLNFLNTSMSISIVLLAIYIGIDIYL
jgi:hypothetical protein